MKRLLYTLKIILIRLFVHPFKQEYEINKLKSEYKQQKEKVDN
jgi:hypothetical protein